MVIVNQGVDAEARDTMPTFDDYLSTDRGKPPSVLWERSTEDLGNDVLPKAAYTSADWRAQEVEHLWKRVWQFACRENDIPVAGDRLTYDSAGQSAILVRTEAGEIKAYRNFCRHRGTRLVDAADNAPEITCSFHGWSWNLDGSLKSVPCRWDFPALSDDEAGLLEVRAESWNGLAFINFDPDAAPLIDFLESLPSHFEQWPGNQLWKAVHVGKVVPCNWKLALEAFLEGYHVVRTHPQLLLYAGDCNGRYDFWGPHARMLASMGVPSPHVGPADEQDVVDAMVRDGFVNTLGEKGGEVQIPQVGPGQTSRSVLADFMKAALTQQTGVDYSEVSDTDVLDTIQYFVFPNVVIFAGYAFPVMYRFRPNGSENSCLWEIMVNVKLPEGMERPPDVPMRMTDPDASWSEVAELQAFGPGLDQDMVNLALFQRGVQQDGYEGPLFSNYQERNLRNFRRHLEGWISQ